MTLLAEGTKVCIIGRETGEPYPPGQIQLCYTLRYDPIQDAYWCIVPFGVVGSRLRPTGRIGWSMFFFATDQIAPTDRNPDYPRPTLLELDDAYNRLRASAGEHLAWGDIYPVNRSSGMLPHLT